MVAMKISPSPPVSPFALPTVRRFILFRVLFNARFYYPVFTVLFLDYGLSLEQFALLNTVWALTIVLAEVPSGALADLLGRQRLLIATGMLMVVEMAIISLVPLSSSSLVFTAFLINRVLSGLAEAMASGADEAIAYDTLVAAGLEKEWPRVLDIQMRLRHLGYIVAMTVGALVYDADTVNRVLAWLGSDLILDQQVTMRFPVFLTLILALGAWLTAQGMRDPARAPGQDLTGSGSAKILASLHLTLEAGHWILATPMALAVILVAMSYDHVLRMMVTMTSEYFRIIGLPEASFGLIGSAIALLGLVVPRLARAMVHRFPPLVNGVLIGLLALAALFGLTLFLPLIGILPVVLVFVAMMLTSFCVSHYLNQLADSGHRATVLSFKGLAFNGAYGLIGIGYAVLMAGLRQRVTAAHPDWHQGLVEEAAFRHSLAWFPGYLLLVLVLVVGFLLWNNRLKAR